MIGGGWVGVGVPNELAHAYGAQRGDGDGAGRRRCGQATHACGDARRAVADGQLGKSRTVAHPQQLASAFEHRR